MQEERGSNSCDYSGCDLVSREFIWSFSLCLKIGYSSINTKIILIIIILIILLIINSSIIYL